MDRHGVRYFFEHKMLPDGFFTHKAKFIVMLLNDKNMLFKIIDDIFKDAKVNNLYAKDDFDIETAQVTDGVKMLKIIFPEPEEEPLCYCSYLFFDDNFEKTSYFCIEKGNELSENKPFVCSWSKEGTHDNYGNCTFEDDNDFLKCIAIHMKSIS